MNGWIKLHRKVLENPIFRRDRTAWHIFETLLIIAERNGEWSGGRIQLADLVGEKDTTTYKAIKRLEKAEMVTLTSNNRFTTISICKWAEYQTDGSNGGNNEVTTKGQPSNTLTRRKEREKERITIYSHDAERLTDLLYQLMQDNYPGLKARPRPSAEEMERINRLDGYDFNVIEAVIRWTQQDAFWKQNIRSPHKLRLKFEDLLIRAESDIKKHSIVEIG